MIEITEEFLSLVYTNTNDNIGAIEFDFTEMSEDLFFHL